MTIGLPSTAEFIQVTTPEGKVETVPAHRPDIAMMLARGHVSASDKGPRRVENVAPPAEAHRRLPDLLVLETIGSLLGRELAKRDLRLNALEARRIALPKPVTPKQEAVLASARRAVAGANLVMQKNPVRS